MAVIQNQSSYTVKFVALSATDDGDNTVVAAVTAPQRIRVLSYAFTASAAGVVKFQDSAGTPVVHAEFDLPANGGVAFAGGVDSPAFELAPGVGLEINNGTGINTTGHLCYAVVD